MGKLPLFSTVGNSFKSALVELYRSIGFTLITSFIWFLGALPIGLILWTMISGLPQVLKNVKQPVEAGVTILTFALLAALVNGLITGPLTTALYSLLQERKEGYPTVGSFFKFLFRFYWISARVNLTFSVGISLLVFNVILMLAKSDLLLIVSGIFSLYGLFLITLFSFYFQPLIYYKHTYTGIFKKAFLLLIDNFGVTFGLGLGLLVFFVVCLRLLFPMALVFGAFYIYFIDRGFDLICQRYEPADENRTKE